MYIIQVQIDAFHYYLKLDNRGFSYEGLKSNATFFLNYTDTDIAKGFYPSIFDYKIIPYGKIKTEQGQDDKIH